MARSVAALAWAASFDALTQKLYGVGREITDGFVQAQMDHIERTERVDMALASGAAFAAFQTLLTRTAAIKAKTDALP